MYNLFYKRKRGENMEEKNVTKISLSTFLLIIAIIAIIVMGVFIYKLNNEKTAEIQKSTELQSQLNNLNGTVSDLQRKINNISETINTDTSALQKNTLSDNIQKDNNTLFSIQGTYSVDDVNHEYNHGCDYIFSGNKVTLQTLDTKEGTFQVEGNKISITFNKFFDPEGNEMKSNTEKEELTILDENTLTHTNSSTGYITKYIKK